MGTLLTLAGDLLAAGDRAVFMKKRVRNTRERWYRNRGPASGTLPGEPGSFPPLPLKIWGEGKGVRVNGG
jgi:hypothetical protein